MIELVVSSRFRIPFYRFRWVISQVNMSGLNFFQYCRRRHGGMVPLLVMVLFFVSSKSGTIFHPVAKERERETVDIWKAQYQSFVRLIVFFVFLPVSSLLHPPSPPPPQICDTEKEEIKEQHKELCRVWLQRSVFYRGKNSKIFFFQGENNKEFQERVP